MKCPYCKNEMLLGYIPNGQQPVQWIPDGERPSLFSFVTSGTGVSLDNKFSPLKVNGYKAIAYCCIDCGIVLAPTKDSKME